MAKPLFTKVSKPGKTLFTYQRRGRQSGVVAKTLFTKGSKPGKTLFTYQRRGRQSGVVAMDPDAVARAFVEHYYTSFDANQAALANLYQESLMLTFEGQKIRVSHSIAVKLRRCSARVDQFC
ncbi:hypothetical protein U1Q18_025764 [Sarracenia purpurea var. burkii]